MTYTLAQAVPFFVGLDTLPLDKVASVDKALRNISQRYYLPPAAKEGRASLYDEGGIVALRLIYNAQAFGLDRILIEEYARWLQGPTLEDRARQAKEMTTSGLLTVQDAIRRVRNDEDFAFHVAVLVNGHVSIHADWQYQEAPLKGEIARFTAPASHQIRALLALMDAES